jgi:hypothetical protein
MVNDGAEVSLRHGVHVSRRGVEGGQVRGSTLRERVGHEAEALAPVCDLFAHQPTRGLEARLWSERALLLCTRAHPSEAIAHARHIGHTDAVEQLGGGWTVRQPWGTGAAPANQLAHSQPASCRERRARTKLDCAHHVHSEWMKGVCAFLAI